MTSPDHALKREESSVLKRFGVYLASVIAAVIAVWLTGVFNQFLPSPERTRLAVENIWTEDSQRPEEGFRIVLCWLENDSNGVDTKRVESAFSGVEGIKLVRSARIVTGFGAWADWSEDMQASARAVLEDWNADLAVVGSAKEPGKVLGLWFVPRSGLGTLERGHRSDPQRAARRGQNAPRRRGWRVRGGPPDR